MPIKERNGNRIVRRIKKVIVLERVYRKEVESKE